MSSSQSGSGSSFHSHVRFYIVMTTLVLGGIFILLLLNNDGGGMSITNALVSAFENRSASDADKLNMTKENSRALRNARDIDLTLTFDQVPSFREEAVPIDVLEIKTSELTGVLIIDGSEVETSSEAVTIRLEGALGTIESAANILFVGTARRIVINNIALSSDDKSIPIEFQTNYESATFEKLDLTSTFALNGNGELTAGQGNLRYRINDGIVSIKAFVGNLDLSREINSTALLALDGIADSVSVSSDQLNLNLGSN